MKVKLSQIVARSNGEKAVVERWRSLGFLNGLKEGGVIERRCALSYQKLTDYLSDDNTPYVGKYLEVWLYAFLRQLLTTKNRVNHIIEPKSILEALDTLTVDDVVKSLYENNYKVKRQLINLLEYKKLGEKKIVDVLKKINKDGDYKLYNHITETDVEAQLSIYAAVAVKEILNKQSAKQ